MQVTVVDLLPDLNLTAACMLSASLPLLRVPGSVVTLNGELYPVLSTVVRLASVYSFTRMLEMLTFELRQVPDSPSSVARAASLRTSSALAPEAAAYVMVNATFTDWPFTVARHVLLSTSPWVIPGAAAAEGLDKPKLMDFSDEVFLGRVIDKVKNVDDIDTVWTVEILDSIKGDLRTGRVQVQQHGYVDGNGRVHQFGDSPILRAGTDYLLLTTQQRDGSLFLLSSPQASPQADTPEQKARLKSEYSEAAKGDSK